MAKAGKVGDIYTCEICGNVVEIKEAGGGDLSCCGELMLLETEEEDES